MKFKSIILKPWCDISHETLRLLKLERGQEKGRSEESCRTSKKSIRKTDRKSQTGVPKKGEERPAKEQTRLEKQQTMTLLEMMKDIPKGCDVGTKCNSKVYQESWKGYKLYIDMADGAIPVSALLSSASVTIASWPFL